MFTNGGLEVATGTAEFINEFLLFEAMTLGCEAALFISSADALKIYKKNIMLFEIHTKF